jgi:hypothetical protein
MRKPPQGRRFLALLAAYVVVLQALLLPLSVAAGAVFDAALCATSSSAENHQPAGHDSACACAAGCGMQCCAPALAGPPSSEFAFVSGEIGILATPATLKAVSKPPALGPHCARAPPSV